MCGIQVASGTPGTFASTLVHEPPPSRVTCTRPSSLPTHISPASSALGAMVRIVVWSSAPDASMVSPPLMWATCLEGSLVVRSGEMTSQVEP